MLLAISEKAVLKMLLQQTVMVNSISEFQQRLAEVTSVSN
jgi:hypothetical protein